MVAVIGLLVKLLGLENYYLDNAGRTGYMLLIDSKSKKVVGQISRQNSSGEIKSMLSQVAN